MAFPSSSSSSSSSNPLSQQFHVFISFRGIDTRKNFTSHLHASLLRKGIDAFIDRRLLGNNISALFDIIERSKISIIIFSQNFSNSDWCLEEVVKILECRKTNKQEVLPVFYKVLVDDVKHQTGSFGPPFQEPEKFFPGIERERVEDWKDALAEASDISGYVVTDEDDRSDADLVEEIASEIVKRLNDPCPSESKDLVGMQSQWQQLKGLLACNEFGCVRIIGLHGMAGIGKTTIAGYMYDRMSEPGNGQLFDGRCFLANVGEKSTRRTLGDLQRELLSELLDDKNLRIGAPETAHVALKYRLQTKRLLVILDDVNSKQQIRLLMGQRNVYKGGSRIIITSRDKKLLGEEFVDRIFEVPRLNDTDALQLFKLNAFTDGFCHTKELMDLSKLFLDYAKGHPYALKLLGCDLRGKEKMYWESKLNRLQSMPDGEIQKVLKISYEELNTEHKHVFLDIACFFRSENEDYVESLLNLHDTKATVQDLVDKCLITRSQSRLEMHDLFHKMANGIVLEGSTDEAGSEKRLWNPKDICHLLKNKTGCGTVRGIFLDMSQVEKMNLSSDVFRGMHNLKYLKFYDSQCSRGCRANRKFRFSGKQLDSLSDKLTYLHWLEFPFENLPKNFDPQNLVDLCLPYSRIKKLWKYKKNTKNLRWIDLSHSRNLQDLSGLAKAGNLEKLNLEGCASLIELPSSITCMDNLVYLNLRECTNLVSLPEGFIMKSLKTLILSGCSSLKKFSWISENVEALFLDGTAIKELPEAIKNYGKLAVLNLKNCSELECIPNSICKLESLEELILSGCSRLKNFPEIQEEMGSLEILLLDNTGIERMPKIKRLSNLKTFSLCGSKGHDSKGLKPLSSCTHLTDLYLTDCNLNVLPNNISRLSLLQCLCLSRNTMQSLPQGIQELHHLKWLDLKYCDKLLSLPELPSNLQCLDAHGCGSLGKVASPLTNLRVAERINTTFIFSNCFKLNCNARDDIVAHAHIKSRLMANASLKHYHRGFILEPLVGICFPGTDMPSLFHHQRAGCSMNIELPPHWCNRKFVGFALCAVVSFKEYKDRTKCFSVKCTCKFENEDGDCIRNICTLGGWNEPCGSPGNEPRQLDKDHVFLSYNNCFHIKNFHGEDWPNKCCHSKASFKFYATDGINKKLGCTEVIKCGLSLLYAPDENQCKFDKAGTSKRGYYHLRDEERPNSKRLKQV